MTDEHNRKVYRIKCESCPNHTDIVASNRSGTLPDTMLEKTLARKGWEFDKKAGGYICDECVDRMKNEARKSKVAHAAIVDADPIETKPDWEAAMIIAMKLDDVYRKETGYLEHWNDFRLADELGVPADWVVQVRRKKYGPMPEPEEVKRIREEIKRIDNRLKELDAMIAEAVREQRKLAGDVGGLKTRLDKIMEAVK